MEKTDQEIPEQKQESFLFSRIEDLSKLNPDMTFDRLVIAPGNQLAVHLAKKIFAPNSPACMLITGDLGTGKTHLLQATCQKALIQGLKVLYLNGYGFTNLFLKASKNQQLKELIDNLSKLDLLALDDIQTIVKETWIQNSLARIIDFLLDNGQKLLVTSSGPLESTEKGACSKLASRFGSGLRLSLNSPDIEIKTALLSRQIEEAGLQISQERLDCLVAYPIKDFYSLFSIAQNLIARAELNQGVISNGIIKEVADVCSLQKEQEGFTTDEIMEAVCCTFKVEELWVKSKSRKKGYTLPRQVYIYLCRKLIPWATLDDISKTVNRIHSTVLYSVEIIEARMKRDPRLKRQVNFIKEKLKEKLKEK